MCAARFQVVSVACSALVPVLREPQPGIGSWAQVSHPQERGFTWRFMSANNRSLAKSTRAFPDVERCLATIRVLQEGLPFAVAEMLRNRHGQWVWRIRLGDEVIVTAARDYQRQVRARLACDAFLHLVAETAGAAPVQVMYQ